MERAEEAATRARVDARRRRRAAAAAEARRRAAIRAESVALADAHRARALKTPRVRTRGGVSSRFSPARAPRRTPTRRRARARRVQIVGDARETRRVRRRVRRRANRRVGRRRRLATRLFGVANVDGGARVRQTRADRVDVARMACRSRTNPRGDGRARDATRDEKSTRAWRAWTAAAKPGIDASRARARAAWLEETQALGRRALTEWSVAARATGEARRRAERKDALFVKVGAWLEELRANKALSPSPEANRRSPAGRAARRAQFKKAGLSPSPSKRRVRPAPRRVRPAPRRVRPAPRLSRRALLVRPAPTSPRPARIRRPRRRSAIRS